MRSILASLLAIGALSACSSSSPMENQSLSSVRGVVSGVDSSAGMRRARVSVDEAAIPWVVILEPAPPLVFEANGQPATVLDVTPGRRVQLTVRGDVLMTMSIPAFLRVDRIDLLPTPR